MKIQLTVEHIQKAIEGGVSAFVCCNCPVFQALKGAGIAVKEVYSGFFSLSDGRLCELPATAKAITWTAHSQWKDIQPCEFEIDYPGVPK